MKKNLAILIVIFAVTAASGFGLRLVFAFSEPGGSPPSSNTEPPITTSSTGQSKTGGLNIATSSGTVGIGASASGTYKLEVAGGTLTGIYSSTSGTNTFGLAGVASGSATGVSGSSASGTGISGVSTSGTGVSGLSASGYGGLFYSTGGSYGVYGAATSTSVLTYGGFFKSKSPTSGSAGAYALNTSATGSVYGLYAQVNSTNASSAAVYGRNTGGSGWAGYFEGPAKITGNLTVDGTISAGGGGAVSGSGTTNYITKWTGTSSLGNSIIFDNGTNVGIGTTTPAAYLHLKGVNIANRGQLTIEGSDYSQITFYKDATTKTGAFYQTQSTGQLNILNAVTNADISMGITGSGNFAVNSNVFTVNASAPGGSFVLNSSGNVGIGTATPNRLLQLFSTNSASMSTDVSGAANSAAILAQNTTDSTFVQLTARGSTVAGTTFGLNRTGIAEVLLNPTTSSVGVMGTFNNAPLVLGTNSVERMRIDTGGNVGIGTTSPAYKLDVQGSGTVASFNGPIIVGTPTLASHSATKSYVDSVIGGGGSSGSFTTLTVTGNTYLATTSGNVGIGTTSPGALLDVAGNIMLSGSNRVISMDSSDGTDNRYLAISGGGGSTGISSRGSYIYFQGNENPSNPGKLILAAGNVATGDIVFRTGADDPKVTILTGGNVGIGSTSPTYKLDVAGTAYFSQPVIVGTPTAASHAATKSYVDSSITGNISGTANYISKFTGSNSLGNSVIYETGGNIGIGTNGPNAKFEVRGPNAVAGDGNEGVRITADTTNDMIDIGANSAGRYAWVRAWRYGTGENTLVLQPLGGKVGIKNTSPEAMLDVEGDIVAGSSVPGLFSPLNIINKDGTVGSAAGASFGVGGMTSRKGALVYERKTNYGRGDFHFLQNSTADYSLPALTQAVMTITNAGNVGIGTTSPAYKLDVSGNTRITGDLTVTGTLSYGSIGADWLNANYGVWSNGSLYMDVDNDNNGTENFIVRNGADASTLQLDETGNLQTRSTIYPGTGSAIQSSYGIWQTGSGLRTQGAFYVDGNVGIGTTGPRGRLEVTDGTNNTTANTPGTLSVVAASTAMSGDTGILTVQSNDAFAVDKGGSITFGGRYTTGSTLAAQWATIIGAKENSTSAEYGGYLAFGTRTTGASTAERMRIDTSGNVGIGTTSPAYKLDVSGDARITGTLTAGTISGGYTGTINAANVSAGDFGYNTSGGNFSFPGNIGIGTTGPTHPLTTTRPLATVWYPDIRVGGYLGGGAAYIGSHNDHQLILSAGGETSDNTNTGPFATARATTAAFVTLNTGGSGAVKFFTDSGLTSGNVMTPTERMRITSTGNVGIGTTGPTSKLQVISDTASQGIQVFHSNLTQGINIGWDAISKIGSGTNIDMQIDAKGTGNLMLQTIATGNVGIGTTSPAYKLDVQGNTRITGDLTVTGTLSYGSIGADWLNANYGVWSNGSLYMDVDNDNNGTENFIVRNGADATTLQLDETGNLQTRSTIYPGTGTAIQSTAGFYSPSGSNGLAFITNSTEKMRIDSSGNVGIGTTGPGVKLDVYGASAAIRITGPSTDDMQIIGGVDPARVGPTTNTQMALWANGAEVMRLKNGNVGIGTTNPTQKLVISGGGIKNDGYYTPEDGSAGYIGYVAGDFRIISQGADATTRGSFGFTVRESDRGNPLTPIELQSSGNVILVGGSGNVGIGTASPGARLDIVAINQNVPRLSAINLISLAANIGDVLGISFAQNSVGDRGRAGIFAVSELANGYASSLAFYTRFAEDGTQLSTADEKVRITSSGNVGIGSTSPGYKLDVQGGQVNASGGLCIAGDCRASWGAVGGGYWTASGANIYNNNAGNVGIGTTSPGYKLEVADSSYNREGIRTTGGGYSSGIGVEGWSTYWGTAIFQGGNARLVLDSNGAVLVGSGYVGGTGPDNGMAIQGDVGVGYTSTSGYKLAVSGTIYASDSIYSASSLVAGRDSNAYHFKAYDGATLIGAIYSDSTRFAIQEFTGARGLNLFNSAGNGLTVATSGNVGIGTTSPGTKLEVAGVLTLNSSQPYINLNASGVNKWQIGNDVIGGSGNNLQFYSANAGGVMTLLQSSGNVGIGTTTPNQPLDILASGSASSQIRLSDVATDATTKNAKILARHYTNAEEDFLPLQFVSNSTDNIVRLGGSSGTFNSATMLSFYTAANATTVSGTERMRIDNNGNVGIGTTSPAYKLDVNGNTNITGNLNVTGTITGTLAGTVTVTAGNVSSGQFGANTGGGNFSFPANVGIGDTTPDGLLDIEGSFDYNNGLRVQSSGTYGSGIMLKNTSAGGKEFYIFSTGSANGEGAGKLSFLDAAVGTRMLIDGSGNVGIGTISPAYALDVVGSIRASGTVMGSFSGSINAANVSMGQFGDNTGGGTYTFPGNVGIGTTSPVQILDIKKDQNAASILAFANANTGTSAESRIQLKNDGTALNAFITLRGRNQTTYANLVANSFGMYTDNTAGLVLLVDNVGPITFGTNAAEKMRIDSSGNVGIGTTGPGTPLHVVKSGNGDTEMVRFEDTHATGNPYISVGSSQTGGGYLKYTKVNDRMDLGIHGAAEILTLKSGNVGIGTTSPTVKLDVNGSARISGTLDMSGNNISGVNKLTVTTIDPEYTFDGKKYATYVASFAGGVKEETTGKVKLTTYNKQLSTYEYTIDFNETEEGSDLWLWRKVIDFSKDNVEVLATPYGELAMIAYQIEGNKIIFKSDKAVEISYRLTGRRNDWKLWPTQLEK